MANVLDTCHKDPISTEAFDLINGTVLPGFPALNFVIVTFTDALLLVRLLIVHSLFGLCSIFCNRFVFLYTAISDLVLCSACTLY